MKRKPCLPPREPYIPVAVGRLTVGLFASWFVDEVKLREGLGRAHQDGPPAVERFKKMLTRVAGRIWDASGQWRVPAVNLTFIFLNRYYSLFMKENPLNKMPYYWDEFIVDISHDAELFELLGYEEDRRRVVCDVIREVREAHGSAALQLFLKKECSGYRVQYPKHDRERSRMFETFLVMLAQMEREGDLGYFKSAHGIEIIKAHAKYLQKFGDPIKMQLGHFIGDSAIWRLRTYLEWKNKGTARAGRFGLEF